MLWIRFSKFIPLIIGTLHPLTNTSPRSLPHPWARTILFSVAMTKQIEEWICIRFCVKLEHSSTETIRMNQKSAAMGKWWLAASSLQCACSCITSHAEFSGKTSNYPGDSDPLQPRFGTCDFWLFPKLKSPLKGKRFQTIDEIQENMMGQLMAMGITVWDLKFCTWKGTEVSLFYIQWFLYLLQ